ncbi:hypothetical protein D3C81_1394470 [compost metagenome]
MRSEARSEPAPGSEKPWHHRRSPLKMAGMCSAFCSGVANAFSTGPSIFCTKPSCVGVPAALHSSSKTRICGTDQPVPPCSFAQ